DVESDEYRVRSGSDFLLDWISNGKVNFKVDFHALRHTGISRLNRAGVSAKILQLFARHSSVELTLGRYTHANQKDMAIAVNSSPEITIPKLLQHRQASVVAHDKSLGAALGAASGDLNGDSVRSIEENRPFPRASA
ncbi:MAG: tyrosine-type recombinase/integrase, partial [Planctomycetota bacterium]|nr:tyrosine-type recombinase/integrase [Planctomycetota bacterium]